MQNNGLQQEGDESGEGDSAEAFRKRAESRRRGGDQVAVTVIKDASILTRQHAPNRFKYEGII